MQCRHQWPTCEQMLGRVSYALGKGARRTTYHGARRSECTRHTASTTRDRTKVRSRISVCCQLEKALESSGYMHCITGRTKDSPSSMLRIVTDIFATDRGTGICRGRGRGCRQILACILTRIRHRMPCRHVLRHDCVVLVGASAPMLMGGTVVALACTGVHNPHALPRIERFAERTRVSARTGEGS